MYHEGERWPLVSIIIPNHNGLKFVERCLKSVLSADYPNFEVIFVDDYSTDGSVELVEKMFSSDSRLRVIRSDRNLGAAEARNIGIKVAKGKYLCFLDNDAEVDPNWLKELIKVLESNTKIGAVQSKFLHMHDHRRIQALGELIIPYLGWIIRIAGEKEDDGSYDNIQEIVAVTVSMAVKRKVIDEVGLFDSDLFIPWEDMDLSWRIWLSGYKEVLAARSRVYHYGGKKPRTAPGSAIEFHMHKNCIRVLTKNYSISKLIVYLPLAMMGMFFRDSFRLIKRNDPYPMLNLFIGTFWNLTHLRDTLKERYKVQRLIRKVSDDYIMKHIMIKLSPSYIYREFLVRGRI